MGGSEFESTTLSQREMLIASITFSSLVAVAWIVFYLKIIISPSKFDAGQQIKRIKAKKKKKSFRERKKLKKRKRGDWRYAKLANFY